MIDFDTIPGSVRVPGRYIEFNTKTAVSGLPQNPQKMVLIAPMTTGRQAALEPVNLFSDAEAADLFGAGSWAHLCVRQAFTNNAYLDLTVIGVADASDGATAATGSVNVSGKATGTGIASIVLGGIAYNTAVAIDDTAEAVASRLRALLAAPDSPATAAGSSGTVALTAKCKGEIGNDLALTAKCTAAGLSLSANAFTGGAGNADISAALAKIAGKRYHIICSAFADDANAKRLSNHLAAVSNAIEKRGAVGVIGQRGSLSAGTTFAGKLNDGRISIPWYKGAIESSALIAAGYAAVLAFEEDPAKPLNTLEIKGLSITEDANWPLYAELNNALYNGLSPLTVVNNKVQILRGVSSYTRNATGTEDPALLDITTIRTLDYVRDAVNQRIALRFPREKLHNRTPQKVRSEILDVLMKLEDAEIIENVAANAPKLLVERAPNDPNRLNAVIPADVVNGLHVFAARIDLYL
ncbi:phage tail sheath subtilisin-like domain-containing protein [Neisseria sp. S1]|uniref:phage tail sheath subtilisin-like domain-containing protein n=1 Tax=Neisseria sp. S1 TaxID=3318354 RepID=UPI003A8A0429